jgi:methylmalonyl-CoA mutase C-terminal domain/subunit
MIRVLLTIPGLGSHDAGAKRVARACRDAGMEVVLLSYRGLSLEDIATAAEQEDIDVIGLSVHSGAHLSILDELMTILAAHGLQDVPVVMGGTINPRDVPRLKELGAREVFGPGSPTREIAEFITKVAHEKQAVGKHG